LTLAFYQKVDRVRETATGHLGKTYLDALFLWVSELEGFFSCYKRVHLLVLGALSYGSKGG